jgi:hypothetical protein
VPVEAHIKEHPAWFKRFEAVWTPTILIVDSEGEERYRIEGYLPASWFRARLKMGIARVAFMHKKWSEAEKIYADVAQSDAGSVAAEAIYWRVVCKYKTTNDHTVLGQAAHELSERYPRSEWKLKSDPWAH